MSRKKSTARKYKEKYGTGDHATWKPWITTAEFNSLGTTSNLVDWKHGRPLQLLSQAELVVYYKLRWDDKVDDIREQYPLDLDSTKQIAEELGVKHPGNGSDPMTSDFYTVMVDGSVQVISVKADRASIAHDQRALEKLAIEKIYWAQKNIPWRMMYKEDVSPIEINNLRTCLVYYDPKSVFDQSSLAKHLIATKKFPVNLSVPIDFPALGRKLEEKGYLWENKYLL